MWKIRKTKEGRNINIGPQPFSLTQTSAIFIGYAIFVSIAIGVFLAEVIWGKINATKKINQKVTLKKPLK